MGGSLTDIINGVANSAKLLNQVVHAGADPTDTQAIYNEAYSALGPWDGGNSGGGPQVSAAAFGGGGRSGGGGGGRGRGGGGGGGGVSNAAYIQALKDYYNKKAAGLGNYLQPYTDAQANIGMAADQARQSITNMGAAQDQRLAQAQQLQQQYNDQLRQALTATGAQYNPGGVLHDLQAQGAGNSGTALQAQLMAQAQAEDAARRSGLADSLIATRNSDLSQRGDISRQETTGFQGALDLAKLAYLAQIQKQRSAAGQQYNDQLDQLRLQLAQQGISI